MSTSKRPAPRKAAAARKASLSSVPEPEGPTEAPADHPGRDKRVEKWLHDRRVEFTFEVQPIKVFDVQKSLQNQARFQALDTRRVEEYHLAMDRGELADFPGLVAYWTPGGKLVIIDGNHRLNGAILHGAVEMPVYVVDAPLEIIQVLTYQANVILTGLSPSVDERVQNAIHLVDSGMSVADAAAALNLKTSELQTAITRSKADRRAARLGVPKKWHKLGVTHRTRLNTVVTDEGFVEAAKVAIDAELTGNEVAEMTASVNESRSATSQIEVCAEYREKYKGRIQKGIVGLGKQEKRGLSAFNRFLGTVTIIENYDKDDVVETSAHSTLTPGELQDRCYAAAEHLMQIAEAVERRAKDGENGQSRSA